MISFNRLWKTLKVDNKYKRDIKEVEYSEINLKEYIVIDVRSIREFKEYHLNSSINIPLPEIKKKIETYVKNKNSKLLICCQSGIRSVKAAKILNSMGYMEVYNVKGGLENI